MENPGLAATVSGFTTTLQSTDYSKLERFSNAADEIYTKLFLSFRECELLVVVPDRYDSEFSIKAAEGKHRTEDSTHIQEIEIINNRKVPKSFQSHLRNLNNKNNLVKYLSEKWRETLPNVLPFSETKYFENLFGATDRVNSQTSERIDFYCDFY